MRRHQGQPPHQEITVSAIPGPATVIVTQPGQPHHHVPPHHHGHPHHRGHPQHHSHHQGGGHTTVVVTNPPVTYYTQTNPFPGLFFAAQAGQHPAAQPGQGPVHQHPSAPPGQGPAHQGQEHYHPRPF